MKRLGCFLAVSLLTALGVAAQGVDFEKAVQQAVKAGDQAKAQKLCTEWIAAKPEDAQPHLILGKLHVKSEDFDAALTHLEIARDLDPLNPEPLCEAAAIFLRLDLPEDALVEFQAALELRPGYAPAAKGLAEAEALLANPYHSGVWIGLGKSIDEHGIRLIEKPHPGRVAKIGGQECRATDKATRSHYLAFDIDDAYLFDVDQPVRVTVDYYDVGKDRFSLRYDSTDATAYDKGASKVMEFVTKADTKTWKQHTFLLPDARFANPNKRDLALWCDAWRREEDLYVSSVQVVQGGLQTRFEPLAATAGAVGSCTVTAKVLDAAGPVADGTPVRFVTDQGTITPEVKTTAGEAKAEFRSGDDPGEANITVSTATDERTLTIPILRGVGKVTHRRLVVHPFGGNEKWEISGSRGTELDIGSAPETGREGRPATRVAYKLRQGDIRSLAGMSRPIPLPGRATALGLWVRPDGSSNSLHIELLDATDQIHHYMFGYLRAARWQWMEVPIGPALDSRGGANDGRLHFPLRLNRLIFRRYYGGGKFRCEGDVYLQDLTVETDIPGSETVSLYLPLDEQRTVLDFADEITFRVGLDNVTAQPKRASLRWSVMDDQDGLVSKGGVDDLAIGPEARTAKDITLDLARPGLYRVKFALGTPDGPTAKPTAPPAEEITFLVLRKMAELGISVDTQPTSNGLTVRLANQGKHAAQVALSYRVFGAEREVLQRGVLGRPDMAVGAGETLECPLTVKGLPPGRYPILLLLDTAKDQRYTSLLSHEVLPNQVVFTGRVAGENGQPVADASVRAQLLRQPHRYSLWQQNETVHAWETKTDKNGNYTLAELDIPGDIGHHHIFVEAAAAGWVDAQKTHSLRRLLASRRSKIRITTLRLERGVRLTGRVIGGDGEPVPNASVYALTAATGGVTMSRTTRSGVAAGGHIRRPIQYLRPRQTGAAGRFELLVHPDASTELTIHSPQWAPKQVTVPTKQPNLGDIQLERGTVVSGALLDEAGKPAVGYWIVAEGIASPAAGQREGPQPASRSGIAAGGNASTRPPRAANPIRVAARTGPKGAFELPPLKGKFSVCTPDHFLLWRTEASRRSPQRRLVILPRTLDLDGTQERLTLELRAVPQVSVTGRMLDVDGTPVKGKALFFRSTTPGSLVIANAAVTDGNGRFVLEEIPQGLRDVSIMAPIMRAWKQTKGIYLRAKPVEGVPGARGDGTVHIEQVDRDLAGLDYQYRFWRPIGGFLDTAPTAPDGKADSKE